MAESQPRPTTSRAVRSTASFLLQHVPVVPPRDVTAKSVARPPSFAEVPEIDKTTDSHFTAPPRKGEDLLPWSVNTAQRIQPPKEPTQREPPPPAISSPRADASKRRLVSDLNQFGRQSFRPIPNFQHPNFETVSSNYKPGSSAWEPTMYPPQNVNPPEVSSADISNVADLLRQANVIGNTKKIIRSGSPVIHVHSANGENQLSFAPGASPGAVGYPNRVHQVVPERSTSPVVRYNGTPSVRHPSESVQTFVHPGVPYVRRESGGSTNSRDPSPLINPPVPPSHSNVRDPLPIEMVQTPPGGDFFPRRPQIRTPPPDPLEQPVLEPIEKSGNPLEDVDVSAIEPDEKYIPTQFKVEQPYSDGENDPQRYSPGRFGATRQTNMSLPASQLPYTVNAVHSEVIVTDKDPSFGINYNTTPGAVFVTSLQPDGAAERAGVPKEGRLVAINDIAIKDPSDIPKAVSVSPNPLVHRVLVDTGYTMAAQHQVIRNHENWIGMKVTVIPDGQRLLHLIMNHGGLVCQTQAEMAVYHRLKGLSGILIDYNTPEARILARFPKASEKGDSVEAWLPITAIKEFESLPEVEKIRGHSPDAAILYNFEKEHKKLKSAVKTPKEDVDIFSKDYRKKVKIQEPDPVIRKKLEELPLMNPDEEIVDDIRLKYEYDRRFAPPDKKFPIPQPRDYSPERIEDDLLKQIENLSIDEQIGYGGKTSYAIPGTRLVIETAEGEVGMGVDGQQQQRQQQHQQQQYQQQLPEELEEEEEEVEYQNTYGFDPTADGVYLKKPGDNLLPPVSDQPQGDDIYPPPHYPHRRDSEESGGESEEELLTAPPMDISPNEQDRQYVDSLQSFQEDMRSYYYKVGPDKYKNQVSNMLTGQDPSGRGCPPELRRVYEKQLELLVEGKNPFKQSRHKSAATPTPTPAPNTTTAASDKSSSRSSSQPPPPEDTPPKKEPKPTKKKAKPKAKKTPAKDKDKDKGSKEKPTKDKKKTAEEESFQERLDAFNDQMRSYYDAAGSDVYKGHVQGLIDTHAIPEELQSMYEKQLTDLKAGKNPWAKKKKK